MMREQEQYQPTGPLKIAITESGYNQLKKNYTLDSSCNLIWMPWLHLIIARNSTMFDVMVSMRRPLLVSMILDLSGVVELGLPCKIVVSVLSTIHNEEVVVDKRVSVS